MPRQGKSSEQKGAVVTESSAAKSEGLSLEDWLAVLEDPDELTSTWAFPDEKLKAEYLDSIASRSDEEVRALFAIF